MKFLTLAVAIALLGIFGCNEPQTMMEQVTRETGETGETPPPVGDILISETDCEGDFRCFPGFSYTNVPGDDNTGQLTIYVDIPEALGDGPHAVSITYDPTRIETDILNKRTLGVAVAETDEFVGEETHSTFFVNRGDTIVFEYQYQYINGELYGTNIEIYENFHLRDPDHEANVEPIFWDEDLGSHAGVITLEPVRKETENANP